MTVPRGIRNNNPGNIEYNGSAAQFKGCIGSDGRFCVFDKPENGIRAIGKVLLTYQRKYAINTINLVIQRWAPASENDTLAYCLAVAGSMACGINDKLDFTDPGVLYRLTSAIIKHENGQMPYHGSQLAAGITSALGIKHMEEL